ncbi:MAG: ATP-binding protein, partial [Sulfolobales archaeon]
CGKTAFLRQASEVLREYGYSVVYVNPLASIPEDRLDVSEELRGLLSEVPGDLGSALRIIEVSAELLYRVVRRGLRRRIALLADDVFQAIGLDRAEQLVKSLLNMIEHPSIAYERIVILIASSEGVTRERIGRHRWAEIRGMWNMPREGFEELYNQIPGEKPSIDDIWIYTGGNPWILSKLYLSSWRVGDVVEEIIHIKSLTREFIARYRRHLERAIEDPDYLWREPERDEHAGQLLRELIERNLVIYPLPKRIESLWIDNPPPERDPELGIGRYVAWQTPLYRIAVRKALVEIS